MQLGDEVIAPLGSYYLLELQRESANVHKSQEEISGQTGSLILDPRRVRIDDILD